MDDVPVKGVFLRTAFNYDRNVASDASGLECKDVSLAKQSFAEECDINTIVRRFGVTGELPVGVRVPTYGDFNGVSDFHSAVNVVAQANESFDAMPADVRARFHNNPGEFLDFFGKPENVAEGRRLGLVLPEVAPVVVQPVEVRVVPPVAPAGASTGGSGVVPPAQ